MNRFGRVSTFGFATLAATLAVSHSANAADCTTDAECQAMVTNPNAEWDAYCDNGLCWMSDWSWGCNGNDSLCGTGDWAEPFPGVAHGTCSVNQSQSCYWSWHLGDGSGGGGMSGGPYINNAAIPAGSSGYSVARVAPTDEQPAPGDGVGAFRSECEFANMRYDDPLVYPQQSGKSHLHVFFGNTAVTASSTADSIATSGNSTCRGGILNRSAYWVPAMIDPNGTPVTPLKFEPYYKTGYIVSNDSINPFPARLRMIAGGTMMGPTISEHAYFTCDESDSATHHTSIPNCPVGDILNMQIAFPQCWDGVDLDGNDSTPNDGINNPDYRSHMAYPENGVGCPASHPIALPEVRFNVKYRVPASGTAGWRLASDMDPSLPPGYSAHGDWVNGWDTDTMNAWVQNCDRTGRDCHAHLLGDGRMLE